jgi:type VI secretion system secreted protein VgrG
MSLPTSQNNLDITIKSTLDDDALIVDELTVTESLHDFFDMQIIVHSENINIDLEECLGTNMTVTFDIHSKKRYFSGIVAKFEQVHTTVLEKKKKLMAFYKIQLKPKLWLLTQSKDYRIFQNKSVQDIIKMILSENSVTDFKYSTTKGTTVKREFCVQYDESNFEFIARLCEEEGIFFYFEHSSSLHTLIFSDKDILPTKLDGKGYPYVQRSPSGMLLNHVYECISGEQITPKEYEVTDYDYLKPAVELSGQASGDRELGGKYFDYPGQFDTTDVGIKIAKAKLNALNWGKTFIQGSSTIPDLTPYKSFKLTHHPRTSLNADYTIYYVQHKISQSRLDHSTSDMGYERIYENQFKAFPAANSFSPVQKHFKKRIHSLQTAVVTGPKGEEIHTDKYGRVKVKFRWDTRGAADEKSSCWIRVAQNWAGKQWGGLVIPRIDMEVIVSFMDGDPDRPLIMGCVYNAESLPPYASDNPTCSTFKTSTSKGHDGNNELRFDDKQEKEEIYFHAQKDFNTEIENDRTEKIIGGNDSLIIEKGNKTEKLEGSGTKYETEITDGDKNLKIDKGSHKIELTNGDQTIEITKGNQKISLTNGDMTIELTKGKSQTTLMNGDMMITLTKGKMDITVQDTIKITSQKDIQFIAGGRIMMQGAQGIMMATPQMVSVQAGQNMTLNAGQNMMATAGMNIVQKGGVNVAIDAGVGLVMKGTTIATNSTGAQALTSSAVLALKGSMLKLN